MITVGEIFTQIQEELGFNPSFLSDNVRNGTNSYPIRHGKIFVRSRVRDEILTHISHLFPCKFSFRVFLSFWLKGIQSSFTNTVSHIINLSSHKKMIWFNTRRIIASMTNIHAFRNLSLMKLKGKSMSKNVFSLSSTRSNSSISFGIFGSNPNPACFSLFDFIKESYFERGSNSGHNSIMHKLNGMSTGVTI